MKRESAAERALNQQIKRIRSEMDVVHAKREAAKQEWEVLFDQCNKLESEVMRLMTQRKNASEARR